MMSFARRYPNIAFAIAAIATMLVATTIIVWLVAPRAPAATTRPEPETAWAACRAEAAMRLPSPHREFDYHPDFVISLGPARYRAMGGGYVAGVRYSWICDVHRSLGSGRWEVERLQLDFG